MVADVFGLHTRTPTEAEIDRGAKALRERQMAGRITRAWDTVPKSEQKKWRGHAEAVLRAAYGS
jgi:sensor domain CHASE-containing protein